MDFALKAALTASLITAIIFAANWLGEQAAGLLAGLPFTALPAFLLIGLERGPLAAIDAAVGGITGCALASVFALAYHVAARRLPPVPTLLFSIVCLAAGLAVAGRWPLPLPIAAVIACGAGAGALRLIRSEHSQVPSPNPRTLSRTVLSALSVGVSGAAVTMIVIAWSPSLAGIVAAMPIIGVATAVTTHTTRGRAAMPRFLRAYVISSLAKCVFCAVFAVCVLSMGIALALLAACVAGACVCVLALELAAARAIGPDRTCAACRATSMLPASFIRATGGRFPYAEQEIE